MHCADVRKELRTQPQLQREILAITCPFALHRQEDILQAKLTHRCWAAAQLISFVELITEKSFMCAPRLSGSFKLM